MNIFKKWRVDERGRSSQCGPGGFDAGVPLPRRVRTRGMIAIPFGRTQQHIVVAAPSYLSGRRSPKTPTELKDHVCVDIDCLVDRSWHRSREARRCPGIDVAALTLQPATD